jgi:hypothetical protein
MLGFDIYLEDLKPEIAEEFLKQYGLEKDFFKGNRPVGALYSPSEEEYEDYFNDKGD